MIILDHKTQPLERWRDGVMTRMHVSHAAGSEQICIFDQFCGPGVGAPVHFHAVEEVLEVINGIAEIQVGNETAVVRENHSVLIPAQVKHSFKNLGESTLHVRATLAEAVFEAIYEGGEVVRRWE